MSIENYVQVVNSTIEIKSAVLQVSLEALNYKIYDIQFETWEPNSLHWVAPSNLIIYSDGTWFLYAQRISNQRRTGGSFDTGNYRTWLVSVEFLNNTGSIVHAGEYILGGLNYKSSDDNISSKGQDNRFAEVLSQIVSARFTQIIR